jgi:hypothetical protein
MTIGLAVLLVDVIAIAEIRAAALGKLRDAQDLRFGRVPDLPQEPRIDAGLVRRRRNPTRGGGGSCGVHGLTLTDAFPSVKTIR